MRNWLALAIVSMLGLAAMSTVMPMQPPADSDARVAGAEG
jgi:hypothetical protein